MKSTKQQQQHVYELPRWAHLLYGICFSSDSQFVVVRSWQMVMKAHLFRLLPTFIFNGKRGPLFLLFCCITDAAILLLTKGLVKGSVLVATTNCVCG